MKIDDYDDEFTRLDSIRSQVEESEEIIKELDMNDREIFDFVVPMYLKQISETLGLLFECIRQIMPGKADPEEQPEDTVRSDCH